ncbi:hypothetical protein [Amycolatopsis thermoflava]|uniref:hypothetical protein n=1 Tax=Amycolatopsis thermoflava TaxID=84480 RepID=UPI0038133E27
MQAMYWLRPWGTDPDTFGAWGQWAGAIASSLAVVVALGLTLAEGRRRRRELADRQAAQARTITATLEPAETFFNGDLIELSVQNHGQLPITSPAREAVRGPWADTDGRVAQADDSGLSVHSRHKAHICRQPGSLDPLDDARREEYLPLSDQLRDHEH